MSETKSQEISEESRGEVILTPLKTRSRRWCYTLNNYSSEEKSHISALFGKEKYFLHGEEIGAEGTEHLQGYVEFTNQKTLSALKKINKRIHWEIAKGTREQNISYCKKDGKVESKKKFNEEEFRKKILAESIADRLTSFNNKWNMNWDKSFIDAFCNHRSSRPKEEIISTKDKLFDIEE